MLQINRWLDSDERSIVGHPLTNRYSFYFSKRSQNLLKKKGQETPQTAYTRYISSRVHRDPRDVRQDGTVIIIINPTRQTKLLGGGLRLFLVDPTSTQLPIVHWTIQ